MKKIFNLLKKITLLLAFAYLPIVGFADYFINYVIDQDPEKIQPVNNEIMAYTPDGGGRYFKSFEEGLDTVIGFGPTSMHPLYIYPGSEIIIKKNITIPKYVQVRFACAIKIQNGQPPVFTTDGYNGNSKVKVITKVTLAQNVVVTVESGGWTSTNSQHGELTIGGFYGDYAHKGNYCEIILNTGAQIVSESFLNVFGQISTHPAADKTKNNPNNGKPLGVYVNNGTFTTLLGVYDLPGSGSPLDDLIKDNVCPFNRYDFPFLRTHVSIDNHANFKGQLNIKRTILGTSVVVRELIDITNSNMKSTKVPLFQINAYADRNKNKIELDYIDDDPNNTYTNLKIFGSYDLGYIKFNVANTYTIDTSKTFLPFSHLLHMEFDGVGGGTFYARYSMKFLPGSMLKINLGSTFDFQKELIFLKDYQSILLNDFKYPLNKGDAYCECNGWIRSSTALSKIGGKVITNNKTGQANIDLRKPESINSSQLFVTSYEGRYSKWGYTDGVKKEVLINAATCQLEGIYYDKNTNTHGICHFEPGKVYTSHKTNSNDQIGWDMQHLESAQPLPTKQVNVHINKTRHKFSVCRFEVHVSNEDDVGGTNYIISNIEAKEGETYTYYTDIKTSLKLFVKSSYAISGCQNNTKIDSTQNHDVSITPYEAVCLFVSESNYTYADKPLSNYSGRGTIQTLLRESMDAVGDHFATTNYYVKAFGSSLPGVSEKRDSKTKKLIKYIYNTEIALKIPKGKLFRLETDYGEWTIGARPKPDDPATDNHVYYQLKYNENISKDSKFYPFELISSACFHQDWLMGGDNHIHVLLRGGSRK